MLPLVLAACADNPEDCASFAEIEVTNPDRRAPPEAIAAVREAVDQFAEWNGGDGVCVGEVRLVEEIDSDLDPVGLYRGPLIEIEHTFDDPMLVSITHHELCHAIDDQLGWFSATRPDWFPSDEPREEFAELCERGPRDAGLFLGLETACDVDVGAARQLWMNEVVFGAAAVEDHPPAGTVPIGLVRREVAGLTDPSGARAAGAGRIVVVREDRLNVDRVALGAAVIDPEAASVDVLVDGPTVPDGPALLASDAAPLAVVLAEDGVRAWRVDASGYEEVPLSLPPSTGRVEAGVVVGDEAFLTVDDGAAERFWRVDLATGAATIVPWPDGVVAVSLLDAHGDVLLGAGTDEEGRRRWVTWDQVTGSWQIEPFGVPSATAGRIGLPDGRVLTAWSETTLLPIGGLQGLAVVDPATGEWWLADDPCDADVIGGSFDLLSIDGEPWLWEPSNAWTPDDPLWGSPDLLTRIER